MDALRRRRQAQRYAALDRLDRSLQADSGAALVWLSQAAPALAEPAVQRRWLEVVRLETRAEVVEAMLTTWGRLSPQQWASGQDVLDTLRSRRSDTAAQSVRLLATVARVLPEAYDDLVDVYQSYPLCRKRVAEALCRVESPPPRVAAFLLSCWSELEPGLRSLVLQSVADRMSDAALIKVLRGTTPSTVRIRILEVLVDRSVVAVEPMLHVARMDPDPACRVAAIRALAHGSSDSSVRAALLSLLTPPDAEPVFLAAVDAVEHSGVDAATAQVLLDVAQTAPSLVMMRAALRVAGPALYDQSDRLLAWFATPLSGDGVRVVCEVLGPILVGRPPVVQQVLAVYETLRDDASRAALLEMLGVWTASDADRLGVYETALKAPSPALRQWAVRGVLGLPMSQAVASHLCVTASALLDSDIDVRWRRALAGMLVRVVDPPPELLSTFKTVVARESDTELRDRCREAVERAPHDVDFELWLRRVQVEHDVRGVFPDVYRVWDQNPAVARNILRVVVLDAQCRASAYQARVDDLAILTFLASKGDLDDGLSRYCVDVCINGQGNAGHLAMLKSHPRWNGLQEAMTQVLGSTRLRNWNTALLRELLVLAHGSDEAAGVFLARHLEGAQTAAAVANVAYLACERAVFWTSAAALMLAAARHPAADKGIRDMVLQSAKRMQRPDLVVALEAPRARGPGLADDE